MTPLSVRLVTIANRLGEAWHAKARHVAREVGFALVAWSCARARYEFEWSARPRDGSTVDKRPSDAAPLQAGQDVQASCVYCLGLGGRPACYWCKRVQP